MNTNNPNKIPINTPLTRLLGGDGPHAEHCLRVKHDWSDLRAQNQHQSCCRSPDRAENLTTAHNKIYNPMKYNYHSKWVKFAKSQGYDVQASIICCSDYPKRNDFIHCGADLRFLCRNTLLCPSCSSLAAHNLVDEYGQACSTGNEIYYVVLSLSSNSDEKSRLILKDVQMEEIAMSYRSQIALPVARDQYGISFQTDEDLADCRWLWSVMANMIKLFTGAKPGRPISGAVGGPELAVQFNPLRVLPHANYLICSPGFSANDARRMRKYISQKMLNCRQFRGRKLYPSVYVYRIKSSHDLKRILSYCCKYINLGQAYSFARNVVNTDPGKMQEINRETNTFLRNLLSVFKGLKRITRFGSCHALHREYFGNVTDYRRDNREKAAAYRKRSAKRYKLRNSKREKINSYSEFLAEIKGPQRKNNSIGRRFEFFSASQMAKALPPPFAGNLGFGKISIALASDGKRS